MTPAPCVTFEDLCCAASAAEVDVLVDRHPDGALSLRLLDVHRCRSLAVAVPPRGFDAAATSLCCSLALAREVPGIAGSARALAGRWPELVALARGAV